MIVIDNIAFDEVVRSIFLTARTDYRYALSNLVPLIDRLHIQRKALPSKFYNNLERDILRGCIMPPLTLSFIHTFNNNNIDVDMATTFVNNSIEEGFVLDGIQRLNTLKRAHAENPDALDEGRPLYLNILICDSADKLLYRMITLNNGQRPMTARHQIEILMDNLYDFSALDITIVSEKEQGKNPLRGSFAKADMLKAYLAYISSSVNIDNQKIIESKMDELLISKVIDAHLSERTNEFSDVVRLIARLSQDEDIYRWFRAINNLIGFCAGISDSYNDLRNEPTERFRRSIDMFETAMGYFNISKVKLGVVRRRAAEYFIRNYLHNSSLNENEFLDRLSQIV